jgi:hypothetical protein
MIAFLSIARRIFLVFGMMSDQRHSFVDYVELGQSFECACFVLDQSNSVAMSGVLIASDIVVTCAHGIKKNGRYILHFYKKNKKIVVTSSTALVDERYKTLGSKFDIAILRLDKPIKNIKPALIMSSIQLKIPLTVATCANDKKRGFYLYELDKYGDASSLFEERALHLSALFFNTSPDFKPSTDEMRIRNQEAIENWTKNGKGPYALALGGTSGAPVFVSYKGKKVLVGVVTSYSTLDKKLEEPSKPLEAMGQYQTIFIPFYLQTKDYDLSKAEFKIDKDFLDLIERCPKAPKENFFTRFYENYIYPLFSRYRSTSKA